MDIKQFETVLNTMALRIEQLEQDLRLEKIYKDVALKDLAAMAVEVGKVCQCGDGCDCGGAD